MMVSNGIQKAIFFFEKLTTLASQIPGKIISGMVPQMKGVSTRNSTVFCVSTIFCKVNNLN